MSSRPAERSSILILVKLFRYRSVWIWMSHRETENENKMTTSQKNFWKQVASGDPKKLQPCMEVVLQKLLNTPRGEETLLSDSLMAPE